MPVHNHFRHQLYLSDPPDAPYELIRPADVPASDGLEYEVATETAYRDITAVYLVHGTLAGTDALGFIGELERAVPMLGAGLRRQHKRFVDAVAGDQGNYVDTFRDALVKYLNPPERECAQPIPVNLYYWSSQNHHCARAEAAVLLIDELLQHDWADGSRIVLWGHSHGGNVLAIVTNLLAGGRLTRDAFWEATAPYSNSLSAAEHGDAWQRVQQALQKSGNPLAHVQLDLATFGTPIRYGWDSGGYAHLVHFVNHVPQPGVPEYRAKFPQTIDEFRDALAGRYGDYFQQTFVAGTNIPPPITNWNAWRTDRMLARLLQRNQNSLDLVKRLRIGRRVADEGQTLLVHYGLADDEAAAMSGHAIYTRVSWLPFHLRQFVARCNSRTKRD